MAAKKFDPKAKAKKQKIYAAVGAVLLLALLAIQVPRTLKMMNRKPPDPVVAPVPVSGDPSVLPTPGTVGGTTGGSAAPAGGGGASGTLVDSDLAPNPEAGQLISFGRFASKDPFKQQIDTSTLDGSSGDEEPATPGTPPGEGLNPPSGTPSTPGVAAGAALISVNGVEETVAVKADFPKDAPVFTLVSLTKGEARIAIAGGAFASGAPTLSLKKGKTITLVNTADGIRYELKLVAVG